MRRMMQSLFWVVLLLEVLLALVCVLSADSPLDGGMARNALNACVSTYEKIGFGNLSAGIGVATVIPLVLVFMFRERRTDRR